MTDRPEGFLPGHSGFFECASCGKRTRETEDTRGLDVCLDCFRAEGKDPAKVAKSIVIRKMKDARLRLDRKHRGHDLSDTLSGVNWSDPSLTPEHLKEKRSLNFDELELDGSIDDQRDVHEELPSPEPVMAIHAPIDIDKYLNFVNEEDDGDGEDQETSLVG